MEQKERFSINSKNDIFSRYKGKKGRAPSTNLVEAGTLQADRLKNRAARKSASGTTVEKVPNMMAVSNIHLQVIIGGSNGEGCHQSSP